jgi:hypothetical protein
VPFDLAVAMAAPALVGRGIDPAPEGPGPALVMRLLLDLPAAPAYFRPASRATRDHEPVRASCKRPLLAAEPEPH